MFKMKFKNELVPSASWNQCKTSENKKVALHLRTSSFVVRNLYGEFIIKMYLVIKVSNFEHNITKRGILLDRVVDDIRIAMLTKTMRQGMRTVIP